MQVTKSMYHKQQTSAHATDFGEFSEAVGLAVAGRESVMLTKLIAKSMTSDVSMELDAVLRKARSRAVPMSAPQFEAECDAAIQREKGLSLSKLLRVGAVCVAIACLETLAFFVAGHPDMGILNPFAAMLFLLASPFFYWMGKLARY